MKTHNGYMTICGVYAPEEGRNEESETFYKNFQKILNKVNKNDQLIVAGDLNARVGDQPIENTIGLYGEPTLNRNGQQLIDICLQNKLKITNTFFKKKWINKYTWSERGRRSMIDYILVNENLTNNVQDVHAYRGAELSTDHYLVVSKIQIKTNNKPIDQNINKQEYKYKIDLLGDESTKQLYQNRLNQYLMKHTTSEDIETERSNIQDAIKRAAEEALGKRLKTTKKKGLKIWNDELKTAIKQKKDAYLRWIQDKENEEKHQEYKIKRNVAKNVTQEAHRESWNKFVSELEHDLYNQQRSVYKVIKHINKDEKDTISINNITENEWLQNYKKLWTDNNEKEVVKTETEDTYIAHIDPLTKEELDEALKNCKNRKATGTDGLSVELYKHGGLLLKYRLLHLYNMCWQQARIPVEWNISIVQPIFKKGNRDDTNNYRGISLLNAEYKIYSKIITKRVQTITDTILNEEQSGFRKGRSTIDNIFTLQQLIEKRREMNNETHFAFVDLVKAFDYVNRKKLWDILKNKGIPTHLIKTIKSCYQNTSFKIAGGNKYEISNRGLRQGCPLSPALFNIYIDEIITEWKKIAPIGIRINTSYSLSILLFADDLVLIAPTEDHLQKQLYLLDRTIGKYNGTISIQKTKVMAHRGNEGKRTKITLRDEPLEQVAHFNYLGCDITYEHENDYRNKINKFQSICGTIAKTLKNKARLDTQIRLYNMLAVPVALYGSETWVKTKKKDQALRTAEMKFLRRIKGITREDRIRNETIRNELQVEPLEEKAEKYKQKWTEHLDRMEQIRIPSAIRGYNPRGRRNVGRPRKRW